MPRTILILALLLAAPVYANTLAPWFGPGAGDGGLALDASAAGCSRMDTRDGVVYVACPQQDAVRRILPTGRVERFAGTYTRPTSNTAPPPGKLARDWPIFMPSDVAPDAKGRVFIVAPPLIYRVTAAGVISAFAAAPNPGDVAAGRDVLYVTQPSAGTIDVYDTDCPGPACPPVRTIAGFTGLLELRGVTVGPDDNTVTILTRTDVRRLMPDGTHFRIALGGSIAPTGPMPALDARLGTPTVLAMDPRDGTLYVADTGGAPRVYRISGTTIAPFAGTGAVFIEYNGPLPTPGTPCTAWPMQANAIAATAGEVFIGTRDSRGFRCSAEGVVLPTPTVTSTVSPSATVTATHSPRPTDTAPPTVTRTRTVTPPPTATATIRPCAPGEVPSCEGPTL